MENAGPTPAGSTRRTASSRFAFTTTRPVAILMVVTAVVVFGAVSYNRLALTLMPDISYPTLTVRTEYPGTAPEEVETLISRPLEQELGIVPKLVAISSISKAGQSDVILEFDWDADMLSVAQDIREKVDRVRLPLDAERPLLLRYDPSLDPILRLGLYGPQSLYELRYLADNDIKRSLESVAGVAAVKVKGGLEEEFQVSLDERKLSLLGIDIQQVNNRLAQSNVNLPGGNLREGQTEYLVRTMNEFRTLDEIGEVIIAREDGIDVRLKDIATVTASHKERQVITRVNGQESIEIEIYKEAGANVVEVARRVRDKLLGTAEQQQFVAQLKAGTDPESAAIARATDPFERRMAETLRAQRVKAMTDFVAYELPGGAAVDVLSDQSVFIQQSIDEVKGNAIVGGLIAVVVLYVFLRNVLHTLIIGVTIPVSIVATFAPMQMFGVSLNIISLGGLALGVGMLVDNAIVVLESIFRCREEGDDLRSAVVRGTGEVGGAVVASTLTTVAVFFPIVFVEGVAGQIFGDMALTVVFSLMASLAVALFFIPMLASRQFHAAAADDATTGAGSRPPSHFFRLAPLSEKPSVGERLGAVGRIVMGIVARIAFCLGAALQALVVAVGAVLAVVGWPIYGMPGLWLRRGQPSWLQRIAATLRGNGAGLFDRLVWPGIASSAALVHLRETVLSLNSRVRSSGGARRVGWALVYPLFLAFVLARFVFETLVRLIASALHLTGFLLALPVLALVRLGTLLLQPMLRPLLRFTESGLNQVQRIYRSALDWSLAHGVTLIAGVFVLFAAVMYLGGPRLGRELIPQVHQGEFNLDVTMPVGTPLERTAEVVSAVERVVMAQPEVARSATSIGSDQTASSSAEEGEHTGTVSVLLKEGSTVQEETALIERIREGVRDVPEIEVEVSYPALFTFKAPIEVEVRGFNLELLRDVSREVEARLSAVPGLADVRSTLQRGNPELQVVYNRDRLAEYGLTLRGVAEIVRNKIQGSVATDFRERERLIDVMVRLEEEDRLGIDELRNLVVNPAGEVPIPLEAVAAIKVSEGPSEIRRVDQERTALITANTQGIDLGTASLLIEDALREMEFPAGFRYLVTGQNEEMQRSLNSMLLALGLALFLVYIVMASQFESLVHPFIIMFTVPLALIGVVLALWAAAMPISIIVFIGMIMLAGIVVNNAIVLIDFINTLRRSGLELHEAVRQAGAARLRPILMTTLTTVLGLLPMALGLGEGAEIRAPMAVTVIVGLVSSTGLTLVVIPTVYVLIERIRARTASVIPA